MKLFIKFFLLVVFLFSSKMIVAQVPANCPDVMLQGFSWDSFTASSWTTLNSQAAEIGGSFDMIWLPPSGNAQTANSMGYLPVYYFNQKSSFGTQANLVTLISTLKTYNCKAIADIVVNHRNGVSTWCNFPTEIYNSVTYTPNSSWICYDDDSRTNAPAGCNNPTGAYDTGAAYAAARDLDHTNLAVRDNIKAYLQFMKNDMGFAGWRYDLVKGYSGSYVGEYNDAAGAYFSVGEYWDGYDNIVNWIDATGKKSAAFDFTFKYAVNAAFNGNTYAGLAYAGQPSGVIGSTTYRQYAVTFCENHDTENAVGNPSPGNNLTNNIQAANAYMLACPGVPCVFFKHWNTYKAEIQSMIAARKEVGIHSQSSVTNIQTSSSSYVAKTIGTKGELIVKIGPGAYTAPGDFTLKCSGTNYAMYTKVMLNNPTLSADKPAGLYVGGTTVTLTSSGGAAPVNIYYTVNNTQPTAASTQYTGTPISISVNNTVLRAVAIDNDGLVSSEVNNTYLTVQPAGITVRFKAPANWSTVKVYAWKNSTTLTAAWSGNVLPVDADGLVSYTTAGSNSGFNVVFNNGADAQTVDILNITSNSCYETTGSTSKFPVIPMAGCFTSLDNTLEKATISIYPNPARETLTVESDLNLSEIQIYSISGVLVELVKVSSTKEVISLENLAPGFYNVVAITEEGARSTSKLIKQ